MPTFPTLAQHENAFRETVGKPANFSGLTLDFKCRSLPHSGKKCKALLKMQALGSENQLY
jgi:hypothetical protein